MKIRLLKQVFALAVVAIVSPSVGSAAEKTYVNYYKCEPALVPSRDWNFMFGRNYEGYRYVRYNFNGPESPYQMKDLDQTWTQYVFSMSGAVINAPNTMLEKKNPPKRVEVGLGGLSSRMQNGVCILVKQE